MSMNTSTQININGLIEFAIQQINSIQPQRDHQELLELSVIFLGGIPPKGIKFHIPGAVHRARWMAKAIYCIKMSF